MKPIQPLPGLDIRPAPEPRQQAMLAHDIRSALNGVLGGVAVVDQSRLDPGLRLQVDRVAAAAEQLAALVLGAIEEPPAPARAASLCLRSFLRSIHRRWAGEADEKGLAFFLEAGPDLPDRLLVDPVDLGRILSNLLGNAVKFTSAGTVRCFVTRAPDGAVRFVLHDDGPGLGACSMGEATGYGFRRPPGAEPGQGLGLYIAKLLTEEIGGQLWLEDRPGGGLEAGLLLPSRLCARDAAVSPPAAPDDPALPNLAGLRVLLAEDNPTNQLVASQMLAAMNAVVTPAGDGLEALARFEEGDFDMVVVDIEMPRKSGLDVIRAIRSRSDRRARTAIVALTAYAMKEHRLRIAEAGADGLISKPITSTEAFGAAIAQHVRRGEPADGPDAPCDPNDVPVVDLGVYESLVDAIGSDMLPELLDRIVADLEGAAAALVAARPSVAAGDIRSNSHILISVAGAFGAARLQRLASDLNAAAHASDAERLASSLDRCLAEVEPAVRFVREKRESC